MINKTDFIGHCLDFVNKNSTIVIEVPNDGAIIRNISVVSDNVKEISVNMTRKSDGMVTPIRGSPTDLPIDDFPIEEVSKIIIEFTSTTDNKSPTGVKLSVFACAPSATTRLTEGNFRIPLRILYPNPLI